VGGVVGRYHGRRGWLQMASFQVTPEVLKKEAGEFDVANIRVLSLKGKRLDNDALGSVARCAAAIFL